MPPPKKYWVLFDMDGTLVDSMPALYQAYREFLSERLVAGTKKEFSSLIGPSIREIVSVLKKRHGIRSSHDRLVKSYCHHVSKAYGKSLVFKKGAVQIIRRLKREGFGIGLVTSSPSRLSGTVLRRKGLLRLFDQTTFGDRLSKAKPHPAIYERAIRKTKGSALRVFVVEDAVNGVLSAKNAGCGYIIGIGPKAQARLCRTVGAHDTVSNLQSAYELVTRRRFETQSCERVSLGKNIRVKLSRKAAARPNDGIFLVRKIDGRGAQTLVEGNFVAYDVWKNGWPNGPLVLAVSGVTVCWRKGEPFFLVGKRSAKVFTCKRHWELVPSGGVSTDALGKDGRIDFIKGLLKELTEESGLSSKKVAWIRPFVLVKDPAHRVYDIGCEISVRPGTNLKRLNFNGDEYERMKFIGRDALKTLFRKEARVVPVSRELVRLYDSTNDSITRGGRHARRG